MKKSLWELINYMQLGDWISIVGAAVSIAACLGTLSQAKAAKKTLMIQKQMFDEGKANFAISEIVNSLIYNDISLKEVYYFFNIILMNLSDKPTSITKIQLELTCANNSKVIILSKDNKDIKPELLRLALPANIQPHHSNTGWVVFSIERGMHKSYDINQQFLIAEDIHGLQSIKEEIFIPEEVIGNDKR